MTDSESPSKIMYRWPVRQICFDHHGEQKIRRLQHSWGDFPITIGMRLVLVSCLCLLLMMSVGGEGFFTIYLGRLLRQKCGTLATIFWVRQTNLLKKGLTRLIFWAKWLNYPGRFAVEPIKHGPILNFTSLKTSCVLWRVNVKYMM